MDKNVNNVIGKYLRREAVGLAKYGVTTERTDVDMLGWIEHLQEELMDATLYLERMKNEVQTLTTQRQFPPLYTRRASDLRGGTPVPPKVGSSPLPSDPTPFIAPAYLSNGCHAGPEDC